MTRHVYLEKERAEAALRAASDFQDHEVKAGAGPNEWRFSKPQSWEYFGNVISRPGMLLLYGDVGELIVMPQVEDPIDWLRGIFKHERYDLTYVTSKVPAEMRPGIVQFSTERVAQLLAEHEQLGPGDKAAVAEFRLDYNRLAYGPNLHDAVKLWLEHELSDDIPDFSPLTWHVMFQVEFLRYFVKALDAQ